MSIPLNLMPDGPDLTQDTYYPMYEVAAELRSILIPKFGSGETQAIIRLIFHYLKGWSATDMIINENRPISAHIIYRIREIVGRLLKDEPIQYIVGNAYFYGMDFEVAPGVLVPRPETEELVELVVKQNKHPDLHILDACTGSGCIAVAIARNVPFSQVEGVDISDKALEVAQRNSDKLKTKVKFIHQDIFTYQPQAESLDVIVSNPPYIDESEMKDMEANVLDYEPHEALFVDDADPLKFYRRIAEIGKTALKQGGRLYFEINPRHAAEMESLLKDMGYDNIEIQLDIHGKKRFATATKN